MKTVKKDSPSEIVANINYSYFLLASSKDAELLLGVLNRAQAITNHMILGKGYFVKDECDIGFNFDQGKLIDKEEHERLKSEKKDQENKQIEGVKHARF